MRSLIDAYGCIDYARQVAHGLAGAALHEAERVLETAADGRGARFLWALPRWMLERA